MGDHQNGQVTNLFEDSWFFGNSLLNTSKSSKIMVRCNSDPSPSSTSKDDTLISQNNPLKMSNLLRTPSLPVCLGGERKYQLDDADVIEVEDDDEPRMGDLIRQAMPIPLPRRRLDRTPSLPPCRGINDATNGAGVSRLARRDALDSSVLVQEKGPIAAVSKLTRRASIDSSLLLPPKCATSKSTKQSTSNLKNRTQRKLEPSTMNNSTAKPETKPQKLDKSKSEKSLSDLEIEELQGFKDLGFSFDNKDINPSVKQILPALQRRASLDSNQIVNKVKRPYLSESWHQSPLSAPPAVPKWKDDDNKASSSSSEDMKAQIKFWARAVASNVRQEC